MTPVLLSGGDLLEVAAQAKEASTAAAN